MNPAPDILLTIPDGSNEPEFVHVESGNSISADDAARSGFTVPPQCAVEVIEGLLRLKKAKEALA